MASDLLQIAASGTRAARAALDVASQNIANAATEGYVRRSVRLSEVAPIGVYGRAGDLSMSGVRVDGVARSADAFRQAEVRRTGADAARGAAELKGLEGAEGALEQSGLYPAITRFEAALQRLGGDPVDPALRSSALESARSLAGTFNLAAQGLDATGQGLRFDAADGVGQVNWIGAELAQLNLRLVRAGDGSSGQAALLDRRDALLYQLTGLADVSASFAPDNTVSVQLGGSAGPVLVSGGTSAAMALATASDGTVSFTLGGNPLTLNAGALAGKAQALGTLATTRTQLDALADNLVGAANGAQTGGVALDGSAGQPLFSGTGAAGIALALTSGAQLATAPAGAPANSRDPANLDALKSALAGAGIAGGADALLYTTSSTVAARRTMSEALTTIAGSARSALDAQAGVDLDAEAVDLVRYQQAFQASGKVIQIASTLFDTLLAIR